MFIVISGGFRGVPEGPLPRAPRICSICFSQKKPSCSNNYLKIEKKSPVHDRNIFLAPGPAAHKTGTNRDVKRIVETYQEIWLF